MNTERRTADHISVSQFMILFWGSLLAPLVSSLLPLQGKIAFLAPLLLLPFLLLWGCLIADFCGEDKGFAQGITHLSHGIFGKCLLFLYLFWGILLLAYQLRQCGMSFLSVGYREGSLYFILPALALFVLWMAGGTLATCARSASFYFGILLLVLFVVLAFSVPQSDWSRVWPFWWQNIPELGKSFLPLTGLFGYGIYASFFWGEVQGKEKKNLKKIWCLWAVLGCTAVSFFIFLAIAIYGTELLQELEKPFFQMAKGVTVEGGFQRVESVVLSLWTLADFILLAVLLRGATQCGKKIVNWQQSPLIMTGITLTATVIALFFSDFLYLELILWGNFLLAWILPCFLFFLKKVLKKRLHSGKTYGIMNES